jgi:D-3-phosphoglycerate dehydrogenase
MIEVMHDADAVLAGAEPYDAELLAALQHLRCISRCGVGTDAIDLVAARRLNIAVLTTADEVIEPVAQMTVAMILALARNFPLHWEDFHAGLWQKHTGHLLSEWTIGLVGFGRIGRAVERYLRIFGSRVIVADPNVQAGELPDGVELCDLASLLAEADLVSLHVSRRPEEGALIGHNEFAVMKPGSRLVNTARGYLVDEAALYKALESGHLAGAALDVFADEPYTGPLATLPQVLCTPHVASLTRASRVAMELRCARNVVEFFAQTNITAKVGSAL